MVITREEFYRRRDDRARRLVSECDYHNVPIGIVASEEIASSTTGQIMLIAAANLMSRWSRTVDLAIPDVDLASQIRTTAASSLRLRIMKEMRSADPFGSFGFRDPRPGALTLGIGPGIGSIVAPDFAVWADGWNALGWRPERDIPQIEGCDVTFLPAAALAACLGAGALFKVAVGQPRGDHLTAFRWSLWDHRRRGIASSSLAVAPPLDFTTVNLGRMLQVGVGAVGSNVLYFLDLLGVQAESLIVDYDHVEIENLDRSLLFAVSDAVPKASKAVAAASRLRGSKLKLDVFVGSWSDLVKTGRNLHELELWIPLANEQDVRRSMANNVPPIMIHGSTSTDWGIFLGRHIPLLDYCLNCRFPGSDVSDSALVCSTGSLDVGAPEHRPQQVDASLPFLSAAAAALVVGEMLKLDLTGYCRLPNYVDANLRGTMSDPVALRLGCRTDCPTRNNRSTIRQTWFRMNGGSRYAHLAKRNLSSESV